MKNGIFIQDLQYPAFSLKRIKGKYIGVSSFYGDPLLSIPDPECQKIYDEATWKRLDDEYSILLQFIPNLDILYRYLIKCKELNIGIRLLYVESDYPDEVCDYDFEDKKFLGYEYCEIPFDSQVITDFDWYEPLHKYYDLLNEYGLFNTLEDAEKFKAAYDDAFQKGYIGDGDMDTYVFKLYEVDAEKFMQDYRDKLC